MAVGVGKAAPIVGKGVRGNYRCVHTDEYDRLKRVEKLLEELVRVSHPLVAFIKGYDSHTRLGLDDILYSVDGKYKIRQSHLRKLQAVVAKAEKVIHG